LTTAETEKEDKSFIKYNSVNALPQI